jgi:uncharacterized membrane protein
MWNQLMGYNKAHIVGVTIVSSIFAVIGMFILFDFVASDAHNPNILLISITFVLFSIWITLSSILGLLFQHIPKNRKDSE